MDALHIVWFKRDLRITDHAALVNAAQHNAVLALFCWEPSVWAGDDYSAQHQAFVQECLVDLAAALLKIGVALHISNASMIETLQAIQQQSSVAAIYSHEETGNTATFMVDKAVANWCKNNRITWHEYPQNGVVRRLKSRDSWHKRWQQHMNAPLLVAPVNIASAAQIILPVASFIQSKGEDKPKRQRGGRNLAEQFLNSFLEGRAANYRGGISSPLKAVTSGSRLSPYLAWGCLSMREVVQATYARRTWAALNPQLFAKTFCLSLIAFESRLHWHCHFMQKLESEPQIEYANMHHAHDKMRDEHYTNPDTQRRLQAWVNGQTGWPLVDACMAMLRVTGWVNFRMRAMLMSTASYLLWLHWRQTGLHLAREFLDYEPGIHWSQTQMQSGTTGINTLRIYNPIKQAQDQDPTGAFVRHWLPQLKRVPNTWIFEPYLMPLAQQQQYGCLLGQDYPMPLVDIKQAIKEARAKISVARKQQGTQIETQAVIKKHASRKGMLGSQRDATGQMQVKHKVPKKLATNPNQTSLF